MFFGLIHSYLVQEGHQSLGLTSCHFDIQLHKAPQDFLRLQSTVSRRVEVPEYLHYT